MCDLDTTCDGFCTFQREMSLGEMIVFTVPVGERLEVSGPFCGLVPCICKRAHRVGAGGWPGSRPRRFPPRNPETDLIYRLKLRP